jgi:hypothetical protein
MQQKELAAVLEAWTLAVADLASNAPRAALKQLTLTTGDLFEAVASNATHLGIAADMAVLSDLQAFKTSVIAKLDQLARRADHRSERADNMQIHMDIQDQRIDSQDDRLDALEEGAESA